MPGNSFGSNPLGAPCGPAKGRASAGITILSWTVARRAFPGSLINSIKSCNSFAAGELLILREVEKRTGKPAAFVETDLVDPRYFSPANVKNRLESYFQMIDQKRAGTRPAMAAAGGAA